MARNSDYTNNASSENLSQDAQTIHIRSEETQSIELPANHFIGQSDILRDGQDLILQAPNGETVVLEGYFNADPAPVLLAPNGTSLPPTLVESFVRPAGNPNYAQSGSLNDASPVGTVDEVSGDVIATRANGQTIQLAPGTPIYQGDIIQTSGEGAVNIVFIDESSFSIAENAKLAIDEYVFDPASMKGASGFSILHGIFTFTSGLIGRDDPDDVEIQTPMGSIGIRGTIIVGNADTGEIAVLEGAIVLRDHNGNEMTLAGDFDSARFDPEGGEIHHTGTALADSIFQSYSTLQSVTPMLFSTLDNKMSEQQDSLSLQVADNSTGQHAPQTTAESTQQQEQTTASFTEIAATDATTTSTNDTIAVADTSTTTTETTLLDNGSLGDSGSTFNTTTSSFTDTTTTVMSAGTTTTAISLITTTSGTSSSTSGNTTTTMISTSGTTLLPLELALTGGQISSTAAAGSNVAYISTTLSFPAVNFTFTSPVDGSNNPLFNFVQTASNAGNVILTAAGAAQADLQGELFQIDMQATLSDGRTILRTFDLRVFEPPLELTTIGGPDGFIVAGSSGEHLGERISFYDPDNGQFLVANSKTTGGAIFTVNSSGSVIGTTPLVGSSEAPSVNALGDFDGDGNLDFATGSASADSSGTDSGFASISTGLGLTGETAGDHLGEYIAGIGDFDGDGLNDVVVSASGQDSGGYTDNGSVYVIYGTAGAPLLNINSLSAADGVTLSGTASGQLFGSSLASAGDFNNDGFGDFMVASKTGGSIAKVDMFYGKTTNTPDLTVTNIQVDSSGGDFDVGMLDMGDVNGDGISDVAIYSEGQGAYVIFGGKGTTNVNLAQDANSNGLPDALESGKGFAVLETGGYELVGGGAIGDYNGDGIDDTALVVQSNGSLKLDVFVLYGSPALSGAVDAASLYGAPAKAEHMTYDLSNVGITDPNADFDFEFSGIGDLNGDGFEDFAIGTPDANNGDGAFTIVYGQPNSLDFLGINPDMHAIGYNAPAAGAIASSNGDSLVGDSSGNTLSNRNGGTDYSNISFRGGNGGDTIQLYGDNARQIDGGKGTDVLEFYTSGAGNTLDLSAMGSESLSGIEEIRMMDNSQTLRIGIDDIFRLMQESGTSTLKISTNGNTGSNLFIEDNTASDPATEDPTAFGFGTGTPAGGYDLYTFGSYTLMIDNNLVAGANMQVV